MSPALRALLTGVIDYAGLFPPAKLPLGKAIRNYGKYRQQLECWMLGRFICTAPQLADLEGYHDEYFVESTPVGFSVLGRGGETLEAFSENLRQDLTEMAAFRDFHGPCVTTDVYEFKAALPIASIYPLLIQRIDVAGATPLSAFVELTQPSLATMKEAIQSLGSMNAERPMGRPVGFKLRCGGLDAAAFPPVETVAGVISACRDARVPLKFTAGLHHPIRRLDAELKAHSHGFLNLFIAGVLAGNGIDESKIHEIVADENAANFGFDENGLRWKDLRADVAQVKQARQSAVTSFGSCSFDEPRDGLRAMGWLR